MGACEAYRDRISAYLDGELTGEERRELLAHLEICGDCRMYLDSELAIREALAGLETPAPEGFEARVMEKIRAESGDAPEEKVAAFPGWRRWAALAACCAVVCLGIFGGGILKGWSALDAAADGRAGSGAAVEARLAEPEEAPAGEAGLPDGEPEEADVSLACTPTVQSGDTAVERDESPAAAVRQASGAQARTEGAAGGRRLTAAGPAARAWVEETLGLAWETGAVYELTEEQYLELTALLAEAGEMLEESAGDAAGWFLLAGEPA